MPDIPFDCLLITRPQAEAEELAERVSDLGLRRVIQPAHLFTAVKITSAEHEALHSSAEAEVPPLLIFTSTRAVEFALSQVPSELLKYGRLAAIGPATAAALQQAGLHPILQAETGYTSEDLLRSLYEASFKPRQAWIIAAAGGRKTLLQGLQQAGVDAHLLFVYQRQPAPLAAATNLQIEQSTRILSVWTSANAMNQLSPQASDGLSELAWQRVCAGEWLVVSPRLAEIAAGYRPAAVHVAAAPGNAELALWVGRLCQRD